ncbi:MAG: enoyl-CoA hydratase/isomerase family protein [Acidimicrobiia bacterium]|nr:enoyl-CoA hydratase/isomerase family protein [Acidimicrobiia bacterium]
MDVDEAGGDQRAVGVDLLPRPLIDAAHLGDDAVGDGDVRRPARRPRTVDHGPGPDDEVVHPHTVCTVSTRGETITLEIDGPVAVITNNNPEKHNAFDDEMDGRLFEILGELEQRSDVRAVIWRAEGKSWSSGRDVGSIGVQRTEMTHHELMTRGHRGIQQVWDIEAPILVAIQGWAIGGSFQRALLCDIRIAADDARFMLPEVGYGVIPDTGGVSVLYEMAGPGLVSDMVLTGRRLSAEEALSHGIVSRVVPRQDLDSVAREMADKIAAAPAVTVKMARRVLARLSRPQQVASMGDELVYQTFINKSEDFAEMRAAASEGRPPAYRGS